MMADKMDSELSAIHDDVREIARSMTEFHTDTAEKLGKIIEGQKNLKEKVDQHETLLLGHEKTINQGKTVVTTIGAIFTIVEGWFHGIAPHLKK